MSYMFSGCSSLIYLDLSNFNTSFCFIHNLSKYNLEWINFIPSLSILLNKQIFFKNYLNIKIS